MNAAAKSVVIAFLVVGTLLCPTDLSSCGPFFRMAVFSFPHQPGRPIAGTSQLGIVKPGFRRLYLFTAFRRLTTPLTAEESRALADLGPKEGAPPTTEEWLTARAKIPGLAKAPNIDVTVTHSSPTDYFQYTNCLDDAFHSAAVTLNARTAKWNGDLVKDWASAQDIVFANCGDVHAPVIPPPATDPQLKADRAYQIAAAYFYANKLDEAETRFRQIAGDRLSPWSDMSAYLIARVQIRRSTLQNDSAAMKMAEAQLQAILADASRKRVQDPARELLPFVRARLNPAGRLVELGQALIKPDSKLSRDLTDYRFLFDKLEGARNLPANRDELTDWLSAFQHEDAEHAAEVWRAKHSLPWLLAAIVPLQPGGAPDVIQAADQVRPDSPAYLTASFHSIRLQIDSNPEQARTRLDGILKDAKLDLSDRNSLYAERMKVAANFEEFLKYAQRVPAGVSWEEGAEVPPDTDPDSPLKNFKQGRTTLDADGAYVLNQRLPLRLMAEAAADQGVSPALRSNIAMAAWTRAVLLGDEAIALQMAPLAPATRTYAAEQDKDHRLFAAVWLMLNNPGLHPYADVGFGRETELNKIDDYRDNWWCAFGAKKEDQLYADFYKDRRELRELIELYPKAPPAATFLSAADQAAGDAEWKNLASIPAAPTYLSAAVVFYAQTHLDDPRVPEALALAVRSTRYGCTDAGTGKVSKQAYDLLRGKFPKSDAAARTKFWYK
jgi:hypothetical protein